EDGDLVAPETRKAADERSAVDGLVLVEAAAVDEARNDLAHVELNLHVTRNDPVELLRVVARLLRLFAVDHGLLRARELSDDVARDRDRLLLGRGRVVRRAAHLRV